MKAWTTLAAAGVAAALLCSCSDFEPVEPYLRILSATPSPWHAEVDKTTGAVLYQEVVFTVGNWSNENCYLTSFEIRYFDVDTYRSGDLSPGNTLALEEGATFYALYNIYYPEIEIVVSGDPGENTYPPGPVITAGGTRVWVPGLDAGQYGNAYQTSTFNVVVADAVIRGISDYWLQENRSGSEDVGIVAVLKFTGESEGGDKVEVEAHVDIGTYLLY